ncbi:MAG TPA: nitroreductase family protein [Prolixibacteraceae bacterium]|nr:nitroreductase family protein [Prolixibacteraceae bacterium]
MIRDLIIKNRSYRRFHQNEVITKEQLFRWIDLARLSASGRNAQPIKYIVAYQAEKNAKVFSTLTWAAFLSNWDGPIEGERPSAYIVQVLDTNISMNYFCDDGIAAQSLLLGAVEEGYGGCIFRSIDKNKLSDLLNIPNRFEIINVIALGKPLEKIVIETMRDNNFKYWRDENEIHHVPKRQLDEIILKL